MAADASRSAVVLAVTGNAFLTILKFVTFATSGSGAMLSEALHSLADTANQALLWIGIRRSTRPATPMFHYGFGAERFLFALFSAIGIFLLGCGVTLYHGVHMITHPPELQLGWPVFAVLAASFAVDGFVLTKAVAAVHAQRGDQTFLQFVGATSDPTILAVLAEDGVACLGVVVAAVGVLLSWATGSVWPDIVATFLIGMLMGAIAVWLGYRNRGLILGRAIPRDVQADCEAFLGAQPSVRSVQRVKTRVLGAGEFRFDAEIDWNGAWFGQRLADWLGQRAAELASEQGRHAVAREFGQRLTEAIGDETDRLEAELVRRHPELRHLDLEGD